MLTSQLGPATCQVLESHTWQMASVSDAAHLSLSSDPQRHLWTQKKKKKSVPDITTLESYAAAAKKTTHSLPNAGISHSGKAPELVCHSVVNMYKNILCTPACKSTALGGKIKCSSSEEQIHKIQHKYRLEYSTSLQRRELELHGTTGMKLTNTQLSCWADEDKAEGRRHDTIYITRNSMQGDTL